MAEVVGSSTDGIAVLGVSQNSAGVKGDSQAHDGVQGYTSHLGHYGVAGTNNAGGVGVLGQSPDGIAVLGVSTNSAGVKGDSQSFDGVQGFSKHFDHFGIIGDNQAGVGVRGQSAGHDGVQGFTHAGGRAGVVGVCDDPVGGNGVLGRSNNASGVVAVSTSGIGILAVAPLAGRFDGNVEVTGDLLLTGADVAEQFDIARAVDEVDDIGPGTVVVLDGEGALEACMRAYDTRVAGVVSGAGDRVPALVLDRTESGAGVCEGRRAVAVVGKVWCLASAADQPIRVGDLLTTAEVRGHAMRAADRESAFGAVLGKALTPLTSGVGLVLVLVGLC